MPLNTDVKAIVGELYACGSYILELGPFMPEKPDSYVTAHWVYYCVRNWANAWVEDHQGELPQWPPTTEHPWSHLTEGPDYDEACRRRALAALTLT